MNSLSDLNNFGATSVEYTDNRFSTVRFSRGFAPDDSELTINQTFTVDPGFDIIEIIKPDLANTQYRITVNSPLVDINFPNVPSPLTATTTTDATSKQATVGFITTLQQWNTVKNPVVVVPQDVFGQIEITVEVLYLRNNITETFGRTLGKDISEFFMPSQFTATTAGMKLNGGDSDFESIATQLTFSILTGVEKYLYNSGSTETISNGLDLDAPDTSNYSITLSPSEFAEQITNITTTATGTFNYNSETKQAVFTGTLAECNDFLDNITISFSPGTDYTLNLEYLVEGVSNNLYDIVSQEMESQNETLLGRVRNDIVYTTNTTTNVSGGPLITDSDVNGTEYYTYNIFADKNAYDSLLGTTNITRNPVNRKYFWTREGSSDTRFFNNGMVLSKDGKTAAFSVMTYNSLFARYDMEIYFFRKQNEGVDGWDAYSSRTISNIGSFTSGDLSISDDGKKIVAIAYTAQNQDVRINTYYSDDPGGPFGGYALINTFDIDDNLRVYGSISGDGNKLIIHEGRNYSLAEDDELNHQNQTFIRIWDWVGGEPDGYTNPVWSESDSVQHGNNVLGVGFSKSIRCGIRTNTDATKILLYSSSIMRYNPNTTSYGGFVLYEYLNGSWSRTLNNLDFGSESLARDGTDVAVNQDYTIIAVGMQQSRPYDEGGTDYNGKVEIWQNQSGSWTKTQNITNPAGGMDRHWGMSVAMNGDGSQLAILSWFTHKIYFYKLVNGSYVYQGNPQDALPTAADGRDIGLAYLSHGKILLDEYGLNCVNTYMDDLNVQGVNTANYYIRTIKANYGQIFKDDALTIKGRGATLNAVIDSLEMEPTNNFSDDFNLLYSITTPDDDTTVRNQRARNN